MRTPRIFAAIFSTALVTALPRPEPKDDQILVRVIAAGVNPGDAMLRSGMFGKSEKDVPKILGADIAGVVEKVGSKITKFKAGDPVFHASIHWLPNATRH